MDERVARTIEVTRAVYREARAENLTFMAGSVAYHAFVSLLPFLVLLVATVTVLGQESLASGIVGLTRPFLTDTAQQVFRSTLLDAAGSSGFSAVGLATLLWGTLKIFRSLDTAFSDIYETETVNSLADQFVDAVVVFVSLGLAVVAATVLGRLLRATAGGSLPGGVRSLALLVGLSVTFLPMYYLFPDEDVTVREVVPGTLFAATGWTTLEFLFGIYVDLSTKTETYGFIGAILVIITWFYFSGFVLLLGASINAVLAGRSEDVAAIDWDRAPDLETAVPDADSPADEWAALARALEDVDSPVGDVETLAVSTGDRTVRLPPPTSVSTAVSTADRPALLGGWSGSAELRASWDAGADGLVGETVARPDGDATDVGDGYGTGAGSSDATGAGDSDGTDVGDAAPTDPVDRPREE